MDRDRDGDRLAFLALGVLIVLQVDNWNKSRPKTQRGHDHLLRIKSDLASDITSMKQRRQF